tara:strand:- start:1161 stop:2831 length:1671 start_codon:yes stop_codon:yes gene_type:complete
MLIFFNLIFKCILSSYAIYQSGNILSKIINYNSSSTDFFEKSFLGFIFMSFIALFLNFFTPLNYLLNTLIFSLIILSFIIDKSLPIKEILVLGLITSLILALAKTNNPDGGLYHLPFIQILNEEKIIFGINNLHFRFALSTMFQYISALHNNFYLGVEGITIPIASIVACFFYFLHRQIFILIKDYSDHNYLISLIYIIILISSLYSFNRYSNYGNDVSLHIFYFLIFLLTIKNITKKISEDDFNLLLLLTFFLLINKITFILAGLFILFILFNLKKNFLFNKTSIFITIFSFIWIVKNIAISGCVIFPIPILCFESLDWTNIQQVRDEKIAGEAWSKGWPDQNIYKDHLIFISNFNWLEAWLSKHFFVIIDKFLPIVAFIFLFSFIFLIKGEKLQITKNIFFSKKFLIIYVITFLNLILWFSFFPIYRYGYSFLLIFFLLTFLYLISFRIRNPGKAFFKKFIIYVLIFGYTSFFIKNFTKVYENYNQNYIGKPFPNIYYSNYTSNIPEIQKKYIENTLEYYYAPNLCFYNKAPCTNYKIDNLKYKKILNYKVLYK